MTDDQALSLFIQEQNTDAFAHLVQRHQGMVYATCTRRLRQREDIEDAVQETFIKLANHAEEINVAVAPWLYRTAYNTCIDIARRNQTRHEHEQQYASEKDQETPWAQARLELDDALQKLNDSQRDLVIRHYFEQQTQAQLALELRINQSTINRRLQGAMKQLHSVMTQRKVSMSIWTLMAGMVSEAASAQVPAAMTQQIVQASISSLGGTSGFLKTLGAVKMWLLGTKLGMTVTSMTVAGTVGVGGYVTYEQVIAPEAKPQQVQQVSQADGEQAIVPEAYQGEWEMVHPDVANGVVDATLVVSNAGMVFEVSGGDMQGEMEISIDRFDQSQDPIVMHMKVLRGSGFFSSDSGASAETIIRLNGGFLEWVAGPPPRAEHFDYDHIEWSEDGYRLMRFQRVNEEVVEQAIMPEAYQGVWSLIIPEDAGGGDTAILSIEDNRFQLNVNDNGTEGEFTFEVNRFNATASPDEIDLTLTQAPGMAEERLVGQIVEGIIQLEEDVLSWSFGVPDMGMDRPVDFPEIYDGTNDSGVNYMQFRRVE